ncbi:MAG: ethanolamine ammonia-lyase subunit EutB [Myxococcales bacterium]|nr:ethanolamine ammonia-lyase subunit EutB [Myxococcales bacterium]
MNLTATVHGSSFTFTSLKDALNKASERKSGDLGAGLAAASMRERVAAKRVIGDVELRHFFEQPSVPYEQDEVTRVVIDDLDARAHRRVAAWTAAQLREWLLDRRTTAQDIADIGPGLTPEMVSAVAKLMSALDLVVVGRKMRVVRRCNNTIGLEGRTASRLQPNHPTDSVPGILAAMKEGLSYGNGDAVIGINPSTESVENTANILKAVKDLMRQHRIPTQVCVLAHVTVQMEALRRFQAPIDLCFQSLAGSEKANRNFGISVALLDEAYDLVRREGTAEGPHVMYFETGQGTALSANAHFGTDQTTMEARAYGLARRYTPFLVNTVVGFIGPEYLQDGKQITRAGLEDHFMGKLMGISMGCDACYTNHADADQDDQEILELLLTSAGCTYLMGIPLGDDVMLNYQTTSFHDNATVRELYGMRPAPEFEAWLERVGLWRNGKLTERAGDPTVFDSPFSLRAERRARSPG